MKLFDTEKDDLQFWQMKNNGESGPLVLSFEDGEHPNEIRRKPTLGVLTFSEDTLTKGPNKDDVLIADIKATLGDAPAEEPAPVEETNPVGAGVLDGPSSDEEPAPVEETNPVGAGVLDGPSSDEEPAPVGAGVLDGPSSDEEPAPVGAGVLDGPFSDEEPAPAGAGVLDGPPSDEEPAPADEEPAAPMDDETFLAELYALLGDTPTTRAAARAVRTAPAEAEEEFTIPASIGPDPAQETPVQTALHMESVEEEPASYTLPVTEQTEGGVPGWLKGSFLLLLSLLLGGMTLYAVALDVLGKVF